MDKSVKEFFTKNAETDYINQYDKDHGPRLDWVISEFKINARFKNARILDVGGGLGFLGKRLDKSIGYTVIDGAFIPLDKRLCGGNWEVADLDYNSFGSDDGDNCLARKGVWDAAFCLETLEHLTNPYNCLVEIKKLVKLDGEIYISIPHLNVTHNYIYPALMADKNNFQQFLEQMALPVIEYKLWDKGWNAHTWRLRNAHWEEAKMLFPKHESKFFGKTPVEYVNL